MPMQDVKKTDMKSETNVKRVRRRNRWLPLYIAVVLVLTAGVGVALSTTVFFNVENIVVTGEAEQYTVTDIVKAADVCSGDNLIKLNTDEVAKRVYDNLIYIETVDVQKKFPDELVINVQKCRESYNIVYDNGIGKCDRKDYFQQHGSCGGAANLLWIFAVDSFSRRKAEITGRTKG